MKYKLLTGIAITTPLLLIALILVRKHTSHTSAVTISTPRPGVTAVRMDPSRLQKAASVWADRSFSKVENQNEIQQLIGDSLERLPLSEKAKTAAASSCWGMIRAYSSGDWNTFISFRIPIEGYEINPRLTATLKRSAPKINSENAIDHYREFWNNLFKDRPFFNEVSLPTNSIVLVTLPPGDIYKVTFPHFTDTSNENWQSIRPGNVFSYDKLPAVQSTQVQVLEFFFFGKLNDKIQMYFVPFVWDEERSAWLPWSMTYAFTVGPTHTGILF